MSNSWATFEAFQDDASVFFTRLQSQIAAEGIDLRHWTVDHVCYRSSSEDSYNELKIKISKFGTLLIESPVNGRLISTFKLHRPLRHDDKTIFLVELPAPKPSKPTPDGFEHIEVVCDVPFESVVNEFPHCRFDKSGLKKPFNQELELQLDGCALKFHHLSLESVVRLESQSGVYSAIQKSQVLERLRQYHPLIAGTFPLGLSTDVSDVDVLFQAEDVTRFSEQLKSMFGNFDGFNSYVIDVDGIPSLIANFLCDGVPFELFCQNVPSLRQRAYRHFQIEERLLSLGGEAFLQKVRRLRSQGMKTEPAFAHALGLNGDPYLELLKLDQKSESELARFFFTPA